MPARLDKIRATLNDLERELAAIDTIDPETRTVLEEARHEIESALHKQEPAQLEHASLIERLDSAAQTFQASHPTLAGVMQRMIDALAQLGI